MTEQTQLPEAMRIKRLVWDSYPIDNVNIDGKDYDSNAGPRETCEQLLTAEALRSQKLVEALENMIEISGTWGKEWFTKIVWDDIEKAKQILREYNQTP